MIGAREISKVDFSSGSYIFIEEEPPASSFKEAKYKGQNIIYFNILNGLL